MGVPPWCYSPRPLSPGRMGEYWVHIGDSWHCIFSIKWPWLRLDYQPLLGKMSPHSSPSLQGGSKTGPGRRRKSSLPPAFLAKKAFLIRRPRYSLTGWDDFLLVLSLNLWGSQLNAPGVYIKINSFDLAFFQGQCLIDNIQCASLHLFMVGIELFHLTHDYSGTYGLSSFGWFIIFRNGSSTGG